MFVAVGEIHHPVVGAPGEAVGNPEIALKGMAGVVGIEAMQAADGPSRLLRLRVGDDLLLARVTRRSCDDLGLQTGETLQAQVKAVAVREL